MGKEWDIVEVLRHSRHDWLNKLQLIKGNLDLNRIDRAKAVIDEIVIDAQHETKLSNIHMPLFAALLLKSNWENPSFKLEYEVLLDSEAIKIDDAGMTNWTNSFFLCLNQSIEQFQDNHLSITIEPQSDGVRFFFDFCGIIIKKELIEKFLAETTIDVVVKDFTEKELTIEVFGKSSLT
ncbi:sporulation initiation phosphotransferase B [Neobacillus sp. MM2021_6]|uniref:sporulation initiation phosphotransferase B n=1 Tax=Bacillaceae TaxID=186817 RepID=UPI00140D7226|nr:MULTISPECIES: sporulation initiation phosphotransferase B [Bacillaceae]MBO0960732.1 sporulation initiation phosphotransferase B [Neobacillus sp. MM2021_6]NHC17346.1 sporulation protein [Bacillus sp. MM2020_4]